MSNEVVAFKSALPSIQMNEQELMSVLKSSLYPGAKDESIKMVIGYCKASGLDPMQKPVHIVPMSVSTGRKDDSGWDIKEMRDVVMPGIGLYRTQAARSGEYAGVTEPEFGEDVTEKLGETQITYPKWSKVTVKRLMQNGIIVEFSAKELWKENYATKSAKSIEPNVMWKRRPYGQLAKCAEAQALRKAFPEIGSQPTADEMEGKSFDGETIDGSTGEIIQQRKSEKPALEEYSAEKFEANKAVWRDLVLSGKKTAAEMVEWLSKRAILSEDQKLEIDSWAHEGDQ
jgi:phage recombination protein Bet